MKSVNHKNRIKKPKSFFSILLFWTVAIIMLSLSIASFFEINASLKQFNKNTQRFETEIINNYKDNIKLEVEKAIEYIEYIRSQTKSQLKKHLKNRVYEAYYIIENIYNNNRHLSQNEIKKRIKEALRTIRFNNGRGYYFIVNLNGIEELYPTEPKFEGKNLLALKDALGNYVIREEINLAKTKGEGFIEHQWRKPNIDRKKFFPKISYIKHFKPLNIYVGTGEYLDEYEKDAQEEILNRLAVIRFSTDGYVYVHTYKGIALIVESEFYKTGDNIIDLISPTGEKIIQQQIKIVKKHGYGFHQHYWTKPGDTISVPKISYIKGVDDWKWIIGAGIYLDNLNKKINTKNEEMKTEIRKDITIILISMLILIFVSFILIRIFTKKIQKNFDFLSNFFEQAASAWQIIDVEKLNFFEFKRLSHSANRMLQERNLALNALDESKKHFSTVVESLPVPLCIINKKDYIEYVNNAFEIFSGYDRDNISKTESWWDLFNVKTEAHTKRFLQLNQNANTAISYQAEFTCSDKSVKTIELRIALLSEKKLLLFYDITQRFLTEKALKERENKFKGLSDATFEAILIEEKGIIIDANKAASILFGYPQIDLIGLKFNELISTKFQKIDVKQNPYELIVCKKNGETFWSEIHTKIAKYKEKEVSVKAVRNITVRKQYELMLKDAKQKAEESDKLKSAFLANMSHEIRTPLNAVIGFSDLLRNENLQKQQIHEYIGYIIAGGNSLLRLIEDIIDFSKLEVNQLIISKKTCNLNEIFDELRNDIIQRKKDIQNFDVNIRLKKYSDTKNFPFITDCFRIKQIMNNLLSNALKFTEKGSIEFGYYPTLKESRAFICFYVKDTGIGIPRDKQELIFKSFTKLDMFQSREYGGTGLGLAITKRLVELLSGTIHIESKPDEGALFYFIIPYSEK